MKKSRLVSKLGAGCLALGGLFLITAIGLGNLESMSSQMMPFSNRPRIEDTSFSAYFNKAIKQEGDTYLARAIAYTTYPGAWAGAQIHNYNHPENPRK
jgi:hypothetical protein